MVTSLEHAARINFITHEFRSLSRHYRSSIKRMSCVRVITLYLFNFDDSKQKVQKEKAVFILSIDMDPNLLLLIMMTIALYFFTKICLAAITASQQRVFAVEASALVDFTRQGAIQRLEDITRQVEEQTINRRAENRVRPQPQENNE